MSRNIPVAGDETFSCAHARLANNMIALPNTTGLIKSFVVNPQIFSTDADRIFIDLLLSNRLAAYGFE